MDINELLSAPVDATAKTAHTDAIQASLKKALGNKPFILIVAKKAS